MTEPVETLGLLADRGVIVVRSEHVAAGVRRIVARPSGLEVVIAARYRAAPGGVVPAPRRLLPAFDEGSDLRLGWLTGPDRAHWAFPVRQETGTGAAGLVLEATFELPPAAGEIRLVLAWPELGVPETVVVRRLPGAAEVGEAAASIWQASVGSLPMPADLRDESVPAGADQFAWLDSELGVTVAGPRVLWRGERAAVVLDHVTAFRRGLALGVLSVAHGRVARSVLHAEEASREPVRVLRSGGPGRPQHGAGLATVDGDTAYWLHSPGGSGTARPGYEFRRTLVSGLPDPPGLEVLVSWPAAGLADALVRVPLPADLAAQAARSEPFWPA